MSDVDGDERNGTLETEREHIRQALAAENGRVDPAAKRLGISRSTLYQKVKVYGLTFGRKSAVS